MKSVVVDASVVLAVLRHETGWEALAPIMEGAAISTVNLSEVIAKLTEQGLDRRQCRQVLNSLELAPDPFDARDAEEAGVLRGPTRAHGLSFGDRACLALGRRLGAPVYTADRAWRAIDVGVEIVVVR